MVPIQRRASSFLVVVFIHVHWVSVASPTLGCSIEISRDWESEASPTLGCSIEISRDICIGYTIARSGLRVHNPRVSVYTRGEAEGYTQTSGL